MTCTYYNDGQCLPVLLIQRKAVEITRGARMKPLYLSLLFFFFLFSFFQSLNVKTGPGCGWSLQCLARVQQRVPIASASQWLPHHP